MGFSLFLDVALRNTGLALIEDLNIINLDIIKYKNSFDGIDFVSIDGHRKFLVKNFKELKENYKIKKLDRIFLEADVFGFRKGGFKIKELMTIVRINYAFSLQQVFNLNAKYIKFIPAHIWKKELFGSSNIKKPLYKDFVISKVEEITCSTLNKKISHDIVDSLGIFLYDYKMSCGNCNDNLVFSPPDGQY
jgi:hypothetical protein